MANIFPFPSPSRPGNQHSTLCFQENVSLDQTLTIQDRKKKSGTISSPVLEDNLGGRRILIRWLGGGVAIKTEVGRTDQPNDWKACLAARKFQGELSDINVEELKIELILLAGLEPPPRKKLCATTSLPPSQLPVVGGRSCNRQAVEAVTKKREATAFPFWKAVDAKQWP